jgi:hypothetical protein
MLRKQILPAWIRFFSWIFLIFWLAPLIFLIGIFGNINVQLHGFNYYGTSLHPFPCFAFSVMLLYAVTAYQILWGKDKAVVLGIISGVVGLLISISAVLYAISLGNFYIALEPLIQIPFIYFLIKRKKEWEAFVQLAPVEP